MSGTNHANQGQEHKGHRSQHENTMIEINCMTVCISHCYIGTPQPLWREAIFSWVLQEQGLSRACRSYGEAVGVPWSEKEIAKKLRTQIAKVCHSKLPWKSDWPAIAALVQPHLAFFGSLDLQWGFITLEHSKLGGFNGYNNLQLLVAVSSNLLRCKRKVIMPTSRVSSDLGVSCGLGMAHILRIHRVDGHALCLISPRTGCICLSLSCYALCDLKTVKTPRSCPLS